jgi:flavoprotein
MPQYLSINIRCTGCEHTWHDLASRDELAADCWPCPECGECLGHRTVNAVMPLRTTKLMRKGDYEDIKAITKLEREMFNKPPSERKEAEREIKQRKQIK